VQNSCFHVNTSIHFISSTAQFFHQEALIDQVQVQVQGAVQEAVQTDVARIEKKLDIVAKSRIDLEAKVLSVVNAKSVKGASRKINVATVKSSASIAAAVKAVEAVVMTNAKTLSGKLAALNAKESRIQNKMNTAVTACDFTSMAALGAQLTAIGQPKQILIKAVKTAERV
jgi:hypothetical protein